MVCQVLQEGLVAALVYAQGLSDLGDHQVRIGDGSKRDEVDTVLEVIYQVGGNLLCKTGLAGAARACKGEQSYIVFEQQSSRCVQLLFAPDQDRALQGQIIGACVQRLEGREV